MCSLWCHQRMAAWLRLLRELRPLRRSPRAPAFSASAAHEAKAGGWAWPGASFSFPHSFSLKTSNFPLQVGSRHRRKNMHFRGGLGGLSGSASSYSGSADFEPVLQTCRLCNKAVVSNPSSDFCDNCGQYMARFGQVWAIVRVLRDCTFLTFYLLNTSLAAPAPLSLPPNLRLASSPWRRRRHLFLLFRCLTASSFSPVDFRGDSLVRFASSRFVWNLSIFRHLQELSPTIFSVSKESLCLAWPLPLRLLLVSRSLYFQKKFPPSIFFEVYIEEAACWPPCTLGIVFFVCLFLHSHIKASYFHDFSCVCVIVFIWPVLSMYYVIQFWSYDFNFCLDLHVVKMELVAFLFYYYYSPFF